MCFVSALRAEDSFGSNKMFPHNVQKLLECLVRFDGDPTKNIGVEPISVYTKFLVNVRCTYDAETQSETSKYCPGYSDAMSLPFSGSKPDKLQRFSDVFCSRCQQEDQICRRLFCAPEYLLVDVALTLIESLCSTLSTEDSNCYNTFCNDRISKRSSNSETTSDNPDLKTNNNIVCVPVGDWSNNEGMDEWCTTNCPMGNDDTCLVTYCDCRLQEDMATTPTTPSSLPLTDCSDWEASQTYSGVSGMTSWCRTVCRVGICPASHCQCAAPETTSISNPPGNPTYSQTTSSTTTPYSSSTVQSTSSLSTAITISPPPETTTSSTTHTVLPSTEATSNSPSTSERTISTSDKSSFGTGGSSTSSATSSSSTRASSQTPATESVSISTGGSSTSSATSPSSTRASSQTPATESVSISTGGSSTSSATSPSSTRASSQAPATDSASTTLTASRPSSTLTAVASTTTTSDGSPGATSRRETTSFSSTKEPSSASSTSTTDSSVSTAATSLSTSEVPTVSSGPPLTTTEHPRVNETERMAAGLRVMSSVICKHTSQLGQTTITNRVCDSDTHDGNFENKGYTTEIIDRVLKFAPSLLCAFMSKSTNSECTNLLCGQNPLIEDALKSSMCSVCRQLTDAVGGGCSLAYCTA